MGCTSAGKTCNAASIRSVTLESSCATQIAVLTGYGLSYGICGRCSPSDSTNSYCFPGRAMNSNMYYHTSFHARGFNCASVPDYRTNPAICPCTDDHVLVDGMRWYKSAGGSAPSCNSICTSAGKTCNAASIRSVTLESSCATQIAVLTGYGLSYGICGRCSPSDST